VLGRLLGIAGHLARALLLFAAFVVSAYLAFNYWVRRGVTPIPDIVTHSESEAREMLAQSGLAAHIAEARRFDAAIPAGAVVETRPRVGSLVKRGAEVEVVLSLGARRIVVPDLVGKSLSAARLTLEGDGLLVGATLSARAPRAESGTVVAQDPPAGTELPDETAVALVVAQAESSPAWVMPDLVARRYEPVRAHLEAGGFRFGAVAYEPYEGVFPGTILRQSPQPGHPLHRQDSISLVVSAELSGSAR